MQKSHRAILLLLFFVTGAFAQEKTIQGKVIGSDNKPLAGANIVVQGTTLGTTTDDNGSFSLMVQALPVTLLFSYVGYTDRTITVYDESPLSVLLTESIYGAEDVTVVGSRFRPRTSITSPVPVDNIKVRDLETTSQVSFDKMMHYVVPSFNSTQQTISDATAHFDPADLRGLGPSRTLVLINGKRKSPSSLVYINDTPGKGDVGVDMGSIPVSAISRVEILRDGASAQYGSDAIAGVINIILNEETESTNVNAYSGVTEEGDGFQFGASVNTGAKIGNAGFVNFSAGYSDYQETNRAGSPGSDVLFGIDSSDPWVQKNPDLGMTVGLPNMTNANIYLNSAVNLNATDQLYLNGGLVYRDGLSYALYRAPYWIPDDYYLLHDPGTEYQGFQPTFETDIFDAQYSAGFRSHKAGWNYDLSYTFGRNKVGYTIANTLNLALEEASPTVVFAGGYEFKNNILNFDASKRLLAKLFLNFGAEFRQENFIATPGQEASYAGAGVQSFPGLQPQNAADANRSNIGAYLDAGLDLTPNLYVGAAVRYENYSDFGENVSYKANARLKSSQDRYSVRASVSSGFRAPSLHQIHLSNIQTLISGGTVSNQGTFNNNDPILRKLGVEPLKEETAINFTAGFAGRPLNDLFVSLDFYQIDLDDRIVYSSSIASDDTNTTVGKILADNNITSLKFFINAVDTRTKGVDLVANYTLNKLLFNAAASISDHSIRGKINTPAVLEQDGVDIFDRKEQSRILTARPTEKAVLGVSYNFNPLLVGVSANYFGEVKWQHVDNGLNGADLGNGPLPTDDAAYDQTFAAKTLIDLHASYRLTRQLSLSLLVNNVFSVYPDVIDTKGDFVTDLGGRFKYPWEVNQFGFNGRVITAAANIRF